MAKNGLLLGSVAFGTSFGLSFVISQNIKTALFTGLITVPATFSGVAVVNRKQRTQQRLSLTALESQIYQLERLETQLNQSLLAIASEKQRTEVNLNFLENQVNQLYTQIADQRSYKQQLTQDSLAIEEHKSRLELELRELQAQIQNCEQRRSELHQYMRTTKAEKQNLEVAFSSVQAEVDHLRLQVAELESQKQEAKQDLMAIKQSQPQPEELQLLQIQTQELEKQKTELNHVLSRIAHERNIKETDLNLLQSQLSQLKNQVLELQINKDNLGQEIIILVERKLQLETEQQTETLSDDWSRFGMQLSDSELQVLKAIVQKEPTAIKKIAEENTTMPEPLIDSINELALDTIGDLIIDPGNDSSVPPTINNEYLSNVNKLLNVPPQAQN